MNNKGFAVSGILYTILIIFMVSMITLLFNLQNRKTILDELKADAVDAVESDNNYEYLLNEINTLKAQISSNNNKTYFSNSLLATTATSDQWTVACSVTVPTGNYMAFGYVTSAGYSADVNNFFGIWLKGGNQGIYNGVDFSSFNFTNTFRSVSSYKTCTDSSCELLVQVYQNSGSDKKINDCSITAVKVIE